jgi:hypothetical protein
MTELTYTLEAEHLAAYQKLAALRAASGGRDATRVYESYGRSLVAGLAVAVPMAALYMFLPVVTDRPFAGVEFVFGLIIGVVILVVAMRLQSSRAQRRFVRLDGPTLSEHQLSLAGDGLRTSSRMFDFLCRWHAFEDVTVGDGIVVMWIEPGMGVVVPRNAFADQKAETAFVDLVRAHVLEAKLPRAGVFA